MAELIAERLTGIPAIGYTNAAMQWGTEQEPNARAAYEFYADTEVELLGFMPHPKLVMSGASPDGRVGRGLIEIKCPNTATHIDTLLGAEIDGKYIKQMQWQMACVDASWCDFVSFDPRLPERMRLHITRVMRDDRMIAELESMALDFLRELDTKVDELTKRYGEKKAA